MLLKALIIWVLIAVAEVGHGVLRVSLLNRRVGDRRARQIGVFSGSAIILAIAWLAAPWLGANSLRQCLAVGALWFALMLAFDVAFGRLVFHASWRRIAAEFDFRQGGLLAIGMVIVLLAPWLAARMRGLL
jgi:hypothetical protein